MAGAHPLDLCPSETEALLKVMASADPTAAGWCTARHLLPSRPALTTQVAVDALPNYLRATIPEYTAHPDSLMPSDDETLPSVVAELFESSGSGKDLDAMSTFFIEQLRLKDPALAFHDQGVLSLNAWASRTDEDRSTVIEALKQTGIVAGDRSKLRKITLEQIAEWSRSKVPPPVPSVLPHQRQSKEEMEVILGSGHDEHSMTRQLVGLGMRGVYGGAIDVLAAPRLGDAAGGDSGAHEAVVQIRDLEIQANIYRSCQLLDKERSIVERLLELCAGDEPHCRALRARLDRISRNAAKAGGAYSCGNPSCEAIESADVKFETCSRCKITRYCSRECQRSHWKAHSKLCIPATAPDAGRGGDGESGGEERPAAAE